MNKEREHNPEKNVNMINLNYTMIKHPSSDNLVNLKNKLDFGSIITNDERESDKNSSSYKNYSICVIGEKNVGKSLIISKLIYENGELDLSKNNDFQTLKSYKRRVISEDCIGLIFHELSSKETVTPSIIYMMNILIFVTDDFHFGLEFLESVVRSLLGLMNYNLKEKTIFLFVNKRSKEKSLVEKIKLFKKDCKKYFEKLKLDKPIQMIYKNFYHLKPEKSIDVLKNLLGAEPPISTYSSFHSDLSGLPVNKSISLKRPTMNPDIKVKKSKSDTQCLIF